MTTLRNDIATQRNGIDLSQYELGTLFEYTPADTWCRDGQAEIVEMFGVRYLVDTYWGSSLEGVLSVEQGREAKVAFVPSQYREIHKHQAEVYGDEKVIVTRRHNGHRVAYFVRNEEPSPSELDQYRHMLRQEEGRLAEHQRGVETSEASIERIQSHIAKLEAAA